MSKLVHLVAALLVGRNMIFRHVHSARVARVAGHADRLLKQALGLSRDNNQLIKTFAALG